MSYVSYLAKPKRVKLKGKKLKVLYNHIYARDGGRCTVCGRPIEYGVKFHHEPCGCDRSDEENKVLMLCAECHYKRHHTGELAEMREACREYLRSLYGEKGAARE